MPYSRIQTNILDLSLNDDIAILSDPINLPNNDDSKDFADLFLNKLNS